MPETRQKRNNVSSSQERAEDSDEVNSNSNHATTQVIENKRSKMSSKNKLLPKTDQSANRLIKKVRAQVQEEDDLVSMQIEGKIDKSDEEMEEQLEDENSQDEEVESEVDKIEEKQNSDTEIQEEPEQSEYESDTEKEDRRKRAKRLKKQEKKAKRESMELELTQLRSTVKVMQDMMTQRGFYQEEVQPSTSKGVTASNNNRISSVVRKVKPKANEPGKLQEKINQNIENGQNKNNSDHDDSLSAETIYRDAVRKDIETGDPEITFNMKSKRGSSSSEDKVNTSDELMEIDDFNEKFIADCARQARIDEQRHKEGRDAPQQMERSQEVIREAEARKGYLFVPKGISDNPNFTNWQGNVNSDMIRSADVDKNYLVLGAHVDPTLQAKIINGEYVDLARLLPK